MKQYKKHDGVIEEKADNMIILLLPENGSICELDEVGRFIWELFSEKEHLTQSDIINKIIDAFSDVPENVSDDIGEYLSTLVENNIIAICEDV